LPVTIPVLEFNSYQRGDVRMNTQSNNWSQKKKLGFTTVSRKSGCDKGLYLKKTCVLEILKRI
jgi:hypothetical protein